MESKAAEYQDGILIIENLDIIREMNLLNCNVGLQTAADGRIWVCVNGADLLRFQPNLRTICVICGDFLDQNQPHGAEHCADRP